MPEHEISLLRKLDPRALSETLRFQGALTARLAERLGEDVVERAFHEVARFELPKDGDNLRIPLVSGQTHLLTSESDRRWAKAVQSQMLRSICRGADENTYFAAYHQAVDDAVEGTDHVQRLTVLKKSLNTVGALDADPNSNLPAPPEHGPIYQHELDLAFANFRPRGGSQRP